MCVDYDPPTVWRNQMRRARKAHRCGECGREIASGETYEVCAGLSEGVWYDGKTCEHCVAAREWLMRICSGYLVGYVKEELAEHVGEAFWRSDDKGLIVLAGRMWNRWQRGGRRMTVDEVRTLRDRALRPWLEAMAA